MRNTIVINAFGGPGSGKTTACFQIACELKKKGYVVEYVPEYAKELAKASHDELDNLYDTFVTTVREIDESRILL